MGSSCLMQRQHDVRYSGRRRNDVSSLLRLLHVQKKLLKSLTLSLIISFLSLSLVESDLELWWKRLLEFAEAFRGVRRKFVLLFFRCEILRRCDGLSAAWFPRVLLRPCDRMDVLHTAYPFFCTLSEVLNHVHRVALPRHRDKRPWKAVTGWQLRQISRTPCSLGVVQRTYFQEGQDWGCRFDLKRTSVEDVILSGKTLRSDC